jgi:hypothetical protein
MCQVWQWRWKVTLSVTQEMMGMTVAMKSYLGRDLGNDGEEGVTAEINKCAECDSDDERLPWAWLGKWWGGRCDQWD